MNTLKNARRAPLPLLLAAVTLFLLTNDQTVSAQTPAPTPAARWSLVGMFVRNTIGAIKGDLEDLAEEFPQLKAFAREAKTDEDSLSYIKEGVRVAVEFRHPLAPPEADAPGGSWRVYRLKDGKLLGVRSHVSAAVYGRGSTFERRVSAIIRAAEAQLLDHAGADTRGSTLYECLILGVEGREPPRAEYLTLVAACKAIRPTGKRNFGFYFTLEVRRVVAGSFDAPEFTVELTSEAGGSDLLRAFGGKDIWQSEGDCPSSRAVEMTFELPGGQRLPGRPGLLQEFRVIE